MNNRTLLLIFLGCLLLFLGGKYLRKDHSSSFDPVITQVDSSRVNRIRFISPGPEGEEFELVRSDTSWEAVKGKVQVAASRNLVDPLIQRLSRLEAKSVVTKDPSKYAEYEVNEDQAVRLIALQNQKEVANILLGGFRFDQATRSASAFVKKEGSPEVYLVDGFALISLKHSFDQYRDKTLVNAEANDLTKLEWLNSSGRKEVIQKEDVQWYYAGMEALDSTAINTYLSSLSQLKGTVFSERTSLPEHSLIEKMTLYGNNMVAPTILSACMNEDTLQPFLIHSSVNPEAIFLSDSSGIYKRIFSDVRQFWPDGK